MTSAPWATAWEALRRSSHASTLLRGRCLARAVRGSAGRARWDVRRDVRARRKRNALARTYLDPVSIESPARRAHRAAAPLVTVTHGAFSAEKSDISLPVNHAAGETLVVKIAPEMRGVTRTRRVMSRSSAAGDPSGGSTFTPAAADPDGRRDGR